MISIFSLAGLEVTRAQISDWLKKDDDPAYQQLSDLELDFSQWSDRGKTRKKGWATNITVPAKTRYFVTFCKACS